MEAGVRACAVASILVLLQEAALLPGAESAQGFIQDDHGISFLNQLLQNDPSSLCRYVSCQEPSSAGHCPQGTLYMPNIAQFGCCGACVRFRQNGEHCTGSVDPMYGGGYGYVELGSKAASLGIGGKPVDNVVDSFWCDYHLLCSEMFQTCEMNTQVKDCLSVQRLYDQAVEGDDFLYYRDDYRWRPDCSPDGNYREKQCKGPQGEERCVCVDPNGERLYGEAYPYQKELYESMNCKCSRRAWERLHEGGESSVTLHCTENGNYEPLQCEGGWCYCLDPDTTIPYGARLPEKAVHFLPCYNKTLMGEQYLRRCESEYHARMEINDLMAFKGVQGPSTLLNCDPDGSYGSKQCDTDMCRCFDKYKVDAISFPSGPGCQCARDRLLFMESNIQVSIKCQVNTGVYAELQTRGNYVFCVDEDGVRAGPLVTMEFEENLSCQNALMCQTTGRDSNCENACSKCPPEAYPKYEGQRGRDYRGANNTTGGGTIV